jgi:hypothetical protein
MIRNVGLRGSGKGLVYIPPSAMNLNIWWEANSLATLFQDAAGAVPVTGANQPVGRINSLAGTISGLQVTATARPTYMITPSRMTMDKIDDALSFTVPAGGWIGTMVLSTTEGTLAYDINLPAGVYVFGGANNPGPDIVGVMIRNGAMTNSEINSTYSYFKSIGSGEGGGNAYQISGLSSYWLATNNIFNKITSFPFLNTASVTVMDGSWQGCASLTSFPLLNTASITDMYGSWQGCISLTSFPLLNTASVTDMSYSWYGCASLTSFPLLNTASVTSFQGSWRDCASLTNFPGNMFNTSLGVNYATAFDNCALTQTSVDNILVSIAAAGTSAGTLNITGGTSATPGAAGLVAKALLVGRGWTVTNN